METSREQNTGDETTHPMKPAVIPIALAGLLLGCQTVNSPFVGIAANIAQSAARLGVLYDLQANPQHRIAFEVGKVALDGFLNAGDFNALKLQTLLQSLPIDQFKGERGAIIVEGAVLIYSIATATMFDVRSAPAVQMIATAIRDGLAAGLAGSGSTITTARGAVMGKAAVIVEEPGYQIIPASRVRI